MKVSKQKHKKQNSVNADMAASAAVANVLLLKKRADDRQRAALRIKFEVSLLFLQIYKFKISFPFCIFATLQILDIISRFAHYYCVILIWQLMFNHILRPAATLFETFRGALKSDSFFSFYLFFLLQYLAAAELKFSSKRTMTEMGNWVLRSTPTCWGSWRSLLHRW